MSKANYVFHTPLTRYIVKASDEAIFNAWHTFAMMMMICLKNFLMMPKTYLMKFLMIWVFQCYSLVFHNCFIIIVLWMFQSSLSVCKSSQLPVHMEGLFYFEALRDFFLPVYRECFKNVLRVFHRMFHEMFHKVFPGSVLWSVTHR